MTRSGNRQLNAALHRIAVTQIRLNGLLQVLKFVHALGNTRMLLIVRNRQLAASHAVAW
jgi:hypothetical protein